MKKAEEMKEEACDFLCQHSSSGKFVCQGVPRAKLRDSLFVDLRERLKGRVL